MNYIENYLYKRALFPQIIQEKVNSKTGIIVVIPSYNEPQLVDSLKALYQCKVPNGMVEVIVVINSSEATDEAVLQQNLISKNEAEEWIASNPKSWIKFHIIHKPDFPKKHAGVGMARKTGMDEATRRFYEIGNEDGIICGFDADSKCDKNYFCEIERFFSKNKSINACSINYEHPIEGTDYSTEIYNRIIQYETYLRYYNQALRFVQHPHAYHTIGSSFGVRMATYAKQGGMNKRKAGEDFYFLQKIIPLGHYGEINTTTVYPSPRPSDRVPFGTGAAIQKLIVNTDLSYPTYNPEAFFALISLFAKIEELYKIDNPNSIDNIEIQAVVKDFLMENDFITALTEIKKNSTSLLSYSKRFFQWFNAFRVLKFLNFAHTDYFNFVPLNNAARQIFEKVTGKTVGDISEKELLLKFREIEKC